MRMGTWLGAAVLAMLAIAPATAGARGLNVEVWTGRGDDAVYRPGDRLEVRARASADAYLLVYEIDSEGYVRLLHPFRNGSGFVEGRRTYTVPPERANVELVVERGSVGQCYIVAIASRERFRELPWYLRPYDLQAESVGYEGMRDDEEGITSEGRIVGDPFVAMEKIRRRVVAGSDDPSAFATGYATYYVHEEVRYPRYLCYDCHRPGRWSWWAGFDPYYTHCSVFDFRVNWSWGWGPGYWFGHVPYYYYIVRADCPPFYSPWRGGRGWFSSWDGWRRWNSMWGDHLVRFKSDPPRGYLPPSKYPDRSKWRDGTVAPPPGYVAVDARKGREGFQPRMITGRGSQARPGEPGARDEGSRGRRFDGVPGRPGAERAPGRDVTDRREGGRGPAGDPREDRRGRDEVSPRDDVSPRPGRPREDSPRVEPRHEGPRQERPREPAPRSEKPRDEGSAREGKAPDPPPAEKPREARGSDRSRESKGDVRRGGPEKGARGREDGRGRG